ncbi:Prolyl-tRNA editing protein ProX (Prolyl-tRNA deacylase ProX) [Durusdinium trenchii]|uniref:Prolyl-tRNA editing protein ProX (Prolyl-tRNA deacylase ProX) n=1 Tax=Durusdinium trenchii TaxID=1381693 RepID=A0ABP0LMM0_9DINO
MAIGKDELLAKLSEWNIAHTTLQHALSPTCEVHSQNLKGTAFEKFIGKGQAKNLFFKVPSGGGPLKNRLFLVCALVETDVDNKALSARMGIKASAPLRFASDDIFDDVLQIPKGSVNPFVMAQSSCSDVFLLLDKQFQKCEGLLFHPMQSDWTTCLSPEQLDAFLTHASSGRVLYVDLSSSDKIDVPALAPKATPVSTGPKAPSAGPSSALASGGSTTQTSGSWYSPPYQTVMGWTL